MSNRSFWIGWVASILLVSCFLIPKCVKADEYFDYCLMHPDHKAMHIGLEALGTIGMYGVCRGAFDDGRTYCVNLDDCRKITLIFGALAGAVVETTQMEQGERSDFAIRDILIFNTIGSLLGIAIVDILFPMPKKETRP